MRFHVDKLVGPAVLLAVVASFVFSEKDSARRDNAQRAQLVAGCSRTSERAVLDAAYKQKTSDVRRAAGTKADIKAADQYQRFALGSLDLVPLPKSVMLQVQAGKVHAASALVKSVAVARGRGGDLVYRVSPQVKALLHQGCVEAYS